MKSKRVFLTSGILAVTFAIFTFVVRTADVRTIGPEGSAVGLAAVNGFVHERIGVHMLWYEITDWFGVIAILTALGFAVLGLAQLIQRRSLRKVDAQILLLGAFYALVAGMYAFFEAVIVNFRPVILDGSPEASYPSSHTMLVICVMATAMMEIRRLLAGKTALQRLLCCGCALIIAVTVIGRLLSGVHWLTDIIGGVLLSAALTALYRAAVVFFTERKKSAR